MTAAALSASTSSVLEYLESRTTLLTVADVATLLNESQKTIYRRVRTGKMPAVKFNLITRFDPKTLAKWYVEHVR